MVTRNLWVFVISVFGLTACQNIGWEEFSEVTKLRVLAIRAEPPEIGPGDIAEVDALVTNPSGADVTLTWELCFLTRGPDDEYSCLVDPETGDALGVPLGSSESVSVSYDVVVEAAGDIDAICEELREADVPAFVSVPNCDRGLELTLRLIATTPDETEVAVKGILMLIDEEAERDDVNVNPTLSGLVVDGVVVGDDPLPLVVRDDEPLRLQALVNASESQQFSPPDADAAGARLESDDEVLSIAWFATHGRFERETTYYQRDVVAVAELQANSLRLTRGGTPAADGDEVRVWAVLRDDRGGVDFAAWTLQIDEITTEPQ